MGWRFALPQAAERDQREKQHRKPDAREPIEASYAVRLISKKRSLDRAD
jgi:hypothetical protein